MAKQDRTARNESLSLLRELNMLCRDNGSKFTITDRLKVIESKLKKLYDEESECDESWEYDEYNINCFSLCIPVRGDMHSNDGVDVRINSLYKYIGALETIANNY